MSTRCAHKGCPRAGQPAWCELHDPASTKAAGLLLAGIAVVVALVMIALILTGATQPGRVP